MERVPRRRRPASQPVAPQSLYNPEIMPPVAKFMCQRGATMAELAHAFKVTETTLYNWLNRHQELHDAVQVGVDVFNPRVERALAETPSAFPIEAAMGRRVVETQPISSRKIALHSSAPVSNPSTAGTGFGAFAR